MQTSDFEIDMEYVEQVAKRLAHIFHGDEIEWRGFLSKAKSYIQLEQQTAMWRK